MIDPQTQRFLMDSRNLVTIYSAANTVQANILRNLLVDEGIDATVINETLSTGSAELVGWSTEPKVQVPKEDEQEARAIAKEWEKQITERGELSEIEKNMLAAEHLTWDGGKCTQCSEPRHAVCPDCEMAGNDFGVAEFEPAEGYDDVAESSEDHVTRLMCTVCDRSFEPQYVRHCTSCGYDFGDGIDVSHSLQSSGLDQRTILVIAMMFAGGLVALCYFITISQ